MDSRRIDTPDELIAAIAELTGAAARQLHVYLPQADAALWSSPGFIDALRSFVTARSHRQVQLLLGSTEGVARDHGALLALAQRLPSLVPLRHADPDFAAPATQAFIVNDAGGLLLFDSGERLAAVLTRAGELARPLAGRFHDAWERARPIAEFRTLGI